MTAMDPVEAPDTLQPTQPPQDVAAVLQASLLALRNQGAQQLDPAGFHYMEVLLQRLQTQPAAVRHILEGRLQQAITGYTDRFTHAQKQAADVVARVAAQHPERARELRRLLALGDFQAVHRIGKTPSPAAAHTTVLQLTQLNEHIRAARHDGTTTSPKGSAETTTRTELASVRQFRETWSRHRAVDQVQQAVSRGPENAGPLNSQMLVIHSLALMRKLSPHYLQRFMAHVDDLLWLEQAHAKMPKSKSKAQKKAPTAPKKTTRKK